MSDNTQPDPIKRLVSLVVYQITLFEIEFAKKNIPVNFKMMQLSVLQHINETYKSLILKDDHLSEVFGDMRSVLHHSEVCILRIMTQVLMSLWSRLNRSDIREYNTMKQDIPMVLENLANKEIEKIRFIFTLMHSPEDCDCELEDCDVEIPLYTIHNLPM